MKQVRRIPAIVVLTIVIALVASAALVATTIPAQKAASANQAQTLTLPIIVALCDHDPEWRGPISLGSELPDFCSRADGVAIAVSGLDGTSYGTCTTEASDDKACALELPVGPDLVLSQDPATIPAGYAPVSNPTTFKLFADAAGGDTILRFATVPNAGSGGQVDLRLMALACETAPQDLAVATNTPAIPAGCTLAENTTVVVSSADGTELGRCMRASGEDYCRVLVPLGSTVTITEEPTTVPDGYTQVEAPLIFSVPQAVYDGLYLYVVNARATASTTAAEPPQTLPAAPSGDAAPLTAPAGNLAYAGLDGNIWIARLDGTDPQQITTDGEQYEGSVYGTYISPAWSHDGTMLAFSGGDPETGAQGIWLLRDGMLSLLPNTMPCGSPVFSAKDDRILYSCAITDMWEQDQPDDLTTNPLHGVVSSSALDGTGQRVDIAYTTDKSGVPWIFGTGFNYTRIADVRVSDGAMLVTVAGHRWAGLRLFAADGTMLATFEPLNDIKGSYGPHDARFTPDGTQVVASWCASGCGRGESGPSTEGVVQFDLDGEISAQWFAPVSNRVSTGLSVSPGGALAAYSFSTTSSGTSTIMLIDDQGASTEIAQGTLPAWQPVTVAIALPNPNQEIANAGFPLTPGGPTPDSGQFAFAAQDDGQWDLYIYNFSGNKTARLTTTPNANEIAPAISHNLGIIAYLSDQSGSYQVWILDQSSQTNRQLTLWEGPPIRSVAWGSDDGSLLITVEGDDGMQIMRMSARGGLISELIAAPAGFPTVAENGTMVYSTTAGGHLVIRQENAATPVAVSDAEPIRGNAPAISPDGTLLVYETGETGTRRIEGRSLDGSTRIIVPASGHDDSNPIITSDGGFVIWRVSDGSRVGIWVATATGAKGAYAEVDVGTHEDIGYLFWQP